MLIASHVQLHTRLIRAWRPIVGNVTADSLIEKCACEDRKCDVEADFHCDNKQAAGGGDQGGDGWGGWGVYNKGRAASKGKRSCKHEMQAEAGRLAHTELNGWMKDKASADTQRTEAVNCTVEITGGEKRERGRQRRGDGGRWREMVTEWAGKKNVGADKT